MEYSTEKQKLNLVPNDEPSSNAGSVQHVNISGGSSHLPPPVLNTVMSAFPTGTDSSFIDSLNSKNAINEQSNIPITVPSTVQLSDTAVPIVWDCKRQNNYDPSHEVLYQSHPRLYTNGQQYNPHAPKDYSPHDSIETRHHWAKREYGVLAKINKREGRVTLVLRFHCYLTKQDYAELFSRLRKELKRLGIEWIAFGEVTMHNGGFPANRLHFHFAFDTSLSPEAMGVEFRAACERAFCRLVRLSDFRTESEYQAAIARRYRKHKTIQLQYGKDFDVTGKAYVTDDGGSWSRFIRYVLKYRYAGYGVDPVVNYYTDGDVKNGQPLVHLFWKYKRGSGTKSFPRLFYSAGWFVGDTHQQQIKRYMVEQRKLALSFLQSVTTVGGCPILAQFDGSTAGGEASDQ